MYACNGILFNHESPATRRNFCDPQNHPRSGQYRPRLEPCLYMGNIDALRDWGHAKDYVRMQWMMLQQEQPEDFVIATGVQYSVREFIQWSAAELGISLRVRVAPVWRRSQLSQRSRAMMAPACQAGRCRHADRPTLLPSRRGRDAVGRSHQGQSEAGLGPRDHSARDVRRDGGGGSEGGAPPPAVARERA